ncbi:M1 family metallopeptidase [Pendulispora rubella]|uniref:M1 family metallopeptidase n=1 Tax=Pendulispora rubella TaxID=2741070 RepID=A0ABZ2LGF3_9BACT
MTVSRSLAFVLCLGACAPGSWPVSESAAPAENAATAGSPVAEPFAADVPVPEHAEDVVDYTLEAKLDPVAHTLHGTGTITWRNTSDTPQSELWLHLYLNAFKNEKSVFLREPVGSGARGGTLPDEWGYIDVRRLALRGDTPEGAVDLWPQAELHRPDDEDETDARVPLPHPVAPGEAITLEVTFDDKLPTVVERTGYYGSFHMVAQWFPKIARLEKDGRWAHFPFHHLAEFYADYGTYDVTLNVPEAFILGATGTATESRIEGGRRIERHVQADVHDFAWTAWDRFQTMRETIDGVAITMLYPPGFEYSASRQMAGLRFTIPYFGQRYGRYPYPILTVVHPPRRAQEAGGMEYPTLITTGAAWYGPPGVYTTESIAIHEYGHEYFYGLLGSNEVKWPFLDEGLNSFAQQDVMDAYLGAGSLADVFGLKVSDVTPQAVGGNYLAHEEPVAQPAYAFSTGWNYGGLVYARTAAIVETIRRVYGDDIVRKAMGLYARRWRFRHPTPEDFLACFTEVVGQGASENLRAALFDKGWIDYEVTDLSSRRKKTATGIYDRDGRRETVATSAPANDRFDGWALITRRGTLTLPVDIDLVLEDGSRKRVHWDGQGDDFRVPYDGNVPLEAAVVDPENRVLLDEDRTNNHRGTLGSAHMPARTLERTTYWAELLLQLVTP